MKLASGTTFFVPMASKSSFYLWSELLKETPFESEEEMSTMCPKINIQMGDITLTAYGHTLKQSCSMVKVGVVNCVADAVKPQPASVSKGSCAFVIIYDVLYKYCIAVILI